MSATAAMFLLPHLQMLLTALRVVAMVSVIAGVVCYQCCFSYVVGCIAAVVVPLLLLLL